MAAALAVIAVAVAAGAGGVGVGGTVGFPIAAPKHAVCPSW